MKPSAPAPVVTVDAQHPWLGLVSYTEETRGYFHGREEEGAELGRRVQRKLLTILFGQSGLGKTSILQAGLVPRLRPEGFCPVYVRLDYDPSSPPPSEQIKRAVFRATAAAGAWTQTGSAVTGETLWEFLHHRDDVLKDANGRTLIPILIFDQFEEIFTLAQSDDAGRRRAQEFLADLADLVENRPPVALEARIDRDEADAAKFDFARADYRILISLREDYLAHLEGLKGQMPSVTQNRMRLARMTGAQAVDAVRTPAPHLVGEAVAEAVVRFVAGGAELSHAEVEPSLLSLICRELNNTRLAQGQAEISANLLAGSRDTILSEFYERTLADQPAGVRIFIEDEMLTESGYRESVAEERVRKAFAAAGAAPDALAKLVDRRLLRVEDRLDLRRVEITHDVLCSVVGASRTVRHEREALEESKRQLAAQKEREVATHRALLRARLVAAVASVLMLVAAGSAIFGWINLRRARVAEAQTRMSRQMAERARTEAEKLVGFLIEDFYLELEPTGRLDTMGKLAQQAVAYYDGLPAELLTPSTRLYRGMALVRQGAADIGRGDMEPANRHLNEARQVFEKLRAEGDQSEATAIGLALALFTKSGQMMGRGLNSVPDLEQAAGLLRPFVKKPDCSRQARRVYVDILNVYSHFQPKKEDGIATCEEARAVLVGLGALDLSDLNAASAYGDTTDSEARHALALGRVDEAERLEREVYEIAEKVLLQRPGDLRSMLNRTLAADLLGTLAERRHDYAEALDYALKGERAGEEYVRSDPSDITVWNMWLRARAQLAFLQYERGRISDALAKAYSLVALENDPRGPSHLAGQMNFFWGQLMEWEAQAGHRAAAEHALRETLRTTGEWLKQVPEGSVERQLAAESPTLQGLRYQRIMGEKEKVVAGAMAIVDRVSKVQVPAANTSGRQMQNNLTRGALGLASLAAFELGDFALAESTARRLRAIPMNPNREGDPVADDAWNRVRIARAVARQGRGAEARTLLEPALAYYRKEYDRGADDNEFLPTFAHALYAAAIAQADDAAGRTQRLALLDEADKALAGLTSGVAQWADNHELAGWIAAARAGAGN
jgi:tetratricopeptide (TPR) repeat protein